MCAARFSVSAQLPIEKVYFAFAKRQCELDFTVDAPARLDHSAHDQIASDHVARCAIRESRIALLATGGKTVRAAASGVRGCGDLEIASLQSKQDCLPNAASPVDDVKRALFDIE